jgi:hypothetical protein
MNYELNEDFYTKLCSNKIDVGNISYFSHCDIEYYFKVLLFLIDKDIPCEHLLDDFFTFYFDHYDHVINDYRTSVIQKIFTKYPNIFDEIVYKFIIKYKCSGVITIMIPFIKKYFDNSDNLKYTIYIDNRATKIYNLLDLSIDKFYEIIDCLTKEMLMNYIKKNYDLLINDLSDVHKKKLFNYILFYFDDLNDIKKFKNIFNIELTQEHLKIVCYTENTEKIKFVLENKVIPNNECFELLIKVENMELFLIHEYDLTYENILRSFRLRRQLPNLENYNIKIDNKILLAFSYFDYDDVPDYIKNFRPTIEDFHEAFKKDIPNIDFLRTYIKLSKRKIDTICLENACLFKSNVDLIKFILTKNIKPSMQSIKNLILNYSEVRNYEKYDEKLCDLIEKHYDVLQKYIIKNKNPRKPLIMNEKTILTRYFNYLSEMIEYSKDETFYQLVLKLIKKM